MGSWLSRLHQHRWVISTLISGLLLTLFASTIVRDVNQHHIVESINDTAEPLLQRIVDRFNRYQYGLQEARIAVLAGGNLDVPLDDFRRLGQTIDLEGSFPGSRGFGFVRRVPASDVTAFIEQMHAEGRSDFELKEFSPNSGERFILQYLEPYQVSTNLQAIGTDIASETRRRQTAVAAMLSGQIRITPPIRFRLTVPRPDDSFLMLMPVYENGVTPSSFEERQLTCFGWLVAPLELAQVLQGLVPSSEIMLFSLQDVTEGIDEKPFFTNGAAEGLH